MVDFIKKYFVIIYCIKFLILQSGIYTIVVVVQPAEMTEEQLMKRKKKALRRKQLEVEKTERDKVSVDALP